ncbi:hypothetical protein OEZ86_008806 [Tetradesmus obliquus]|nr:hypothetical protein OEZ86_008806 [Tetradesmus obliquus]
MQANCQQIRHTLSSRPEAFTQKLRQQPFGPHYSQARQRRSCVQVSAVKSAKRLKYAGIGQRAVHDPLFVSVQADGSDAWRLEPVIQLLKDGGVGIIPTDSLPAVVCDLENRTAALKMYNAMDLAPKKQLSILVGSFNDISKYTAGFPLPTQAGQADLFRMAQRLLPGPYTFILGASKNLPSQVVDFRKGKTRQRKSVGVRMPDDPVCRAVLQGLGGCLLSHSVHAVLQGLGGCLLSHSVHVDETLGAETEVPDPGMLMDMYGQKGLDFIVDTGRRTVTATSVVDMTTSEPEVIREGRGDVSMFI